MRVVEGYLQPSHAQAVAYWFVVTRIAWSTCISSAEAADRKVLIDSTAQL